ncbi:MULTISPECIES: EF-hand domain-containing protein [Aeromonas]|uniref:EF-hand domain-containing protein n=1 Tax=Aeromonas taiwanensis TaxID=633417 RepID=A0A5F0KCR4_9GAMM|nr:MULTISPECIES: EF-hand domain-containing protein [Aeromonas]MBP4041747.1 EF-hand domain-containing protein [Aeromonas sp. SrichE-2G]MCO4205786.1 EF-hand domain-containing protein [Aeromonas taiwanensis]TFF77773.1 EF-hand domain-containing protein [Aeromonas taiwanensis]TFF78226.1 EF-hand domain-containing protein [Aeromonas taiwanensis]TFF82039.1 EF-hand domain-containing protein [Aeromonas taiwanensis]
MLKFYLLPLVLLGGAALAAEEPLDEPMMLIKGDITKAQFMERAEQRFARQDTDKDGTLSVAEREAAMAKMHEAMQQSGKAMPGKMGNMGNMRPMQDTTKEQFMARHEAVFTRMDKNGDGVLDEAERASVKGRLGQGMMAPAQQ